MTARPLHQRGVAALMAVLFLLFMLGVVLVMANQMATTDVHDSGAQNLSVGALFLAESGVERAVHRYGNGTACNASLADGAPITFGGGTFQALGTPVPAVDGVTGLCNLRVTGTLQGVSRTLAVGLRQGGAISLRGSSSNTGGGGAVTSLTIARPAGVVNGDVMLAQISVRANLCAVGGITPPAGWTLVTNGCRNSGTALAQAVYYKLAGGAEPADYTWNFANGRASGGIVAFLGVNTTTPVNAANGQAYAASSDIIAPSITTTVANTMLVGLFGTARADAISPPGSMPDEAYDQPSGGGPNGVTAAVAYAVQAAVGATGPRTATNTSGNLDANIGHLVALRPGGAGGNTQVVTWSEP